MSERLKPLFVIKPDTMSQQDIKRAEEQAGIVIVECAEPESVRLMDIPIDAQIDVQARAALGLIRVVASSTTINYSRDWLVTWFVNALVRESRPRAVERVKKVK